MVGQGKFRIVGSIFKLSLELVNEINYENIQKECFQ